MKLRRAGPEDAARVRDLLFAAFTDYARGLGRDPVAPDWVPARIASGEVWWCEAEGTPGIGVAVLAREGQTLIIDRLAIDPAHQKAGLGTAAMRGIEAHARADGITRLTLRTAQPFTHLVAFYSRLGFEVTHLAANASGRDTIPRVHMAKALSQTPRTAS